MTPPIWIQVFANRVTVLCWEPCDASRQLAQDWFGDGLPETGRSLDGERTGNFLRVLEDVERSDLAPPQGDHVDGMLEVPAAVQQRRGSVPLDEHHRVPGRPFHPDVVDREMEIGQHAC